MMLRCSVPATSSRPGARCDQETTTGGKQGERPQYGPGRKAVLMP